MRKTKMEIREGYFEAECWAVRILKENCMITWKNKCAKRADGVCCSRCSLFYESPKMCTNFCGRARANSLIGGTPCDFFMTREEVLWKLLFGIPIGGKVRT